MRAWCSHSATSSAGVRRYAIGVDHPEFGARQVAEIDVMQVDWCGIDEEGEPIQYWDPPRWDEPYLTGMALSSLMWYGECPSGRRAKDADRWKRFDSLWDAICGLADYYGWVLEVEGYPDDPTA